LVGRAAPLHHPPDWGPYRVLAHILPAGFELRGFSVDREAETAYLAEWDGRAHRLVKVDLRTGERTIFRSIPDPAGGFARPTLDPSGRRLWVFFKSPNEGGGLDCLDPATGRSLAGRPYYRYLGLFYWSPRDLTFDTSGRLWVEGPADLHRYSLTDDGITEEIYILPSLAGPGDDVRDLLALPDGRMWVCQASGLYEFDPEEIGVDRVGRPSLLTREVSRPSGVTEAPPRSLALAGAPDDTSSVWVPAGPSLLRYDPKRDAWEDVTEPVRAFGLVLEVYPTPDGNLWLTTTSGLVWFEPSTGRAVPVAPYDPDSGEHLDFMSVSLVGITWEFVPRFPCVDARGNLWFVAELVEPGETYGLLCPVMLSGP